VSEVWLPLVQPKSALRLRSTSSIPTPLPCQPLVSPFFPPDSNSFHVGHLRLFYTLVGTPDRQPLRAVCGEQFSGAECRFAPDSAGRDSGQTGSIKDDLEGY